MIDIKWMILAGGKGSRLNNQDKGLVIVHNKTIVEHIIHQLNVPKHQLLINANRNHSIYAQYATVTPDLSNDYLGPLAGIQSGMSTCDTEWLGVLPCDGPNLPKEFTTKMLNNVSASKIHIAFDGEHTQPTYAVYHTSLLPELNAFLKAGHRRLQQFQNSHSPHLIDFSQDKNDFKNINTLQDLIDYQQLSL
ncbi:molybdenum cofactor guanylyltransferase [Vibrio sp.]|nr:molybdenum cofactor guanylyltransferase [Vibrio sp.]